MREVKKGSTNITVYFHLRDSADGTSKTALLYNSAGAVASYVRNGAARTAITLATLASASAAHSDGGFILVDDTNAKGLYRLDIPDAAFATGVDDVVVHIGFTGVFEESLEIVLVDNTAKDNYDRIGAPAGASVSADNAAIKAKTALIVADTNELQTNQGNWLTATGFSTHSAADVWSVATRLLTAGTNIVLAKGTGVTGFNDLSVAQVNAECDTAISDAALATAASLVTAQTDLDTITGADGVTLATAQGNYAPLKGGVAMTESYAADGATATPEQILYMIWAALSEFAVSGTTITAKRLDGSTPAMTFTLDDGTDPTSRTRAA